MCIRDSFGDARYNMGNSLMMGCAKMGLNFTACAPKKYQPDAALVACLLYTSDPQHKVSLLMAHTEHPCEVADPWFTGDIEATSQDILEGCTALLEELRYQR